MLLLDMRTIIFSNVLTDIVCVAVIALLWQQNRKHFDGTGFLVFDFALQTTALLLIILRGQIPAWMSFVAANTMVIAGALLGYMGLMRFVGKKSSQIHNYALLTAFAFIHAYFTFVQPNQAARNLNISVGLLIICFQCMWLLLSRAEPGMRQLTRGVGIVFGIYCLISIIRIIEFFSGAHAKIGYFQSGTFEQIVLISYQMLFIILTYSLTLMVNKLLQANINTGEEKFSKAFHSSPYAITITRMSDGQIIEVNNGFFNITGYQLADIREKTTLNMHLWDRNEDRALVVNELASKGKVLEREFQFRKKSGERITGLFSAEIIAINNEKCVLSSINDITARKQAEAQREATLELLRKNEQELHLITDNVRDTIWLMDLGMRTTWISPSVIRTRGYTLAELAEMPMDRHLTPGSLARMMELSTIHLTPERLADPSAEIFVSEELEYYRKDGSTFWADTVVTLLRDKDGRPSGFMGVGRDITERKQAEEGIIRLNTELEKQVAKRTKELHESQFALLNLVDDLNQSAKNISAINQELEATNKELEAFSYSVSHDLRAPLRSIDGFSLALLEDYQKKLDDTGRNYLEKVRTATQHMGNLIDDMLKLSRVTRSEFHPESIDLSKMVNKIAQTCKKSTPRRTVQIAIQEGIIVQGDPNSLQIALTNLIDNAWKFTGKQKHPRIEFGATLKKNEKIFFIRDNGAGFDMAYVNKLFGAFQRLHTVDEFAGTGIGLATVQRIINRHRGKIWAEGEVGKGATFFFTLPA